MKNKIYLKIGLGIALFLGACVAKDKTPNLAVDNFVVEKYLGNWYEIARLDHSFEKNCEKVQANYSLIENSDKIKVINSCIRNGKKDSAKAVANFAKSPKIGHLEVSFFRPFYGNYKIIYLDEKYETAIIDGGSYEYFWILSRKEKIEKKQLDDLLIKAEKFGFDTKKLIFTKQ